MARLAWGVGLMWYINVISIKCLETENCLLYAWKTGLDPYRTDSKEKHSGVYASLLLQLALRYSLPPHHHHHHSFIKCKQRNCTWRNNGIFFWLLTAIKIGHYERIERLSRPMTVSHQVIPVRKQLQNAQLSTSVAQSPPHWRCWRWSITANSFSLQAFNSDTPKYAGLVTPADTTTGSSFCQELHPQHNNAEMLQATACYRLLRQSLLYYLSTSMSFQNCSQSWNPAVVKFVAAFLLAST